MSFTCSYCGQTFCSDHRLPEYHQCPALPNLKRSKWSSSKKESEQGHPDTDAVKQSTTNAPSRIYSNLSYRVNTFRRKYFNKYQYQRVLRKSKKTAFVLSEVSILVILSVPIWLTYLIDLQISSDPFTSILLRNVVNENVLIPTGIYVVSGLYLLYRQFSGYKLRFEWILVLSTSLISTWYIIRFLNTMSALSMIFLSSRPEIPNVLVFYEVWIMQLLSSLLLAFRFIQSKAVEFYSFGSQYLTEIYHQYFSTLVLQRRNR